jgi:hypothetical protein
VADIRNKIGLLKASVNLPGIVAIDPAFVLVAGPAQ